MCFISKSRGVKEKLVVQVYKEHQDQWYEPYKYETSSFMTYAYCFYASFKYFGI